MQKKVLLFVFLMVLSFSSYSSTYYISSRGDDLSSGTSATTAWRTINKVNNTRLFPGDIVLFEAGNVFIGGLELGSTTQGTTAHPIVFSSYGIGRAIINSGTGAGFYAHNAGGIELRDLEFTGSGRLANTSAGVEFYLDSANVHLQHLVLDNINAHGYRDGGIIIGSWNGTSGYDQVRVTRCTASANGSVGIVSYAELPSAHHNWYVGYCQAFDNSGRADITDNHTGSGIILGGIDEALVEYSEAYHNGWLNANQNGGPVGIWGYYCNNLTIQYCESHHNESGTCRDGGGFDLDGGCTNSVLQYNYSHDNTGPGYLLAQYPGAPPMHDLTIRYNISENDGRGCGQGALLLWSTGASGGIQRANIHNNTIYVSPPADGSRPKAVDIISGGISEVVIRNNVFQTTGGLPLIASMTTEGVLLQGNAYWSSGQTLQLNWGSGHYNSLEAWRAASGQEKIGARTTGIEIDPQLQQPGAGGTLAILSSGRQLTSLTAYHLQSGSNLMNAGLDLLTEFNLNSGPRDFFGNPTPARGAGRSIGAYENSIVASSANAAKINWCSVYPNPARGSVHLSVVNLGATGRTPISIKVYDMMGRLQFSQTRQAQADNNLDLQLQLGALAAGRYHLEVLQGNQRYSEALLVE
ncbi:T9SS type A sorting domain-containing protein [Hymenobacter volaticus]|uniref:T9SS type A sorting domain-containing protein n=1 Tax=Hymenobacter volaticus TaxID=2932254 RepID=A0ABY4G2Y6_9BACT|nr:T9SS type A sorting domain-containing protein [Hymenobacter volaticus]UOQ65235.1 T9SS type A sorting domain-containing protein [Hymenobacter volaticus]